MDELPFGLTVSEDGSLLNWQGVNYVRQVMPGGYPCAICGDAYDHGGMPHGLATGDGETRKPPPQPDDRLTMESETGR